MSQVLDELGLQMADELSGKLILFWGMDANLYTSGSGLDPPENMLEARPIFAPHLCHPQCIYIEAVDLCVILNVFIKRQWTFSVILIVFI